MVGSTGTVPGTAGTGAGYKPAWAESGGASAAGGGDGRGRGWSGEGHLVSPPSSMNSSPVATPQHQQQHQHTRLAYPEYYQTSGRAGSGEAGGVLLAGAASAAYVHGRGRGGAVMRDYPGELAAAEAAIEELQRDCDQRADIAIGELKGERDQLQEELNQLRMGRGGGEVGGGGMGEGSEWSMGGPGGMRGGMGGGREVEMLMEEVEYLKGTVDSLSAQLEVFQRITAPTEGEELEKEAQELTAESLELATELNTANKEAEQKEVLIEQLKQELVAARGGRGLPASIAQLLQTTKPKPKPYQPVQLRQQRPAPPPPPAPPAPCLCPKCSEPSAPALCAKGCGEGCEQRGRQQRVRGRCAEAAGARAGAAGAAAGAAAEAQAAKEEVVQLRSKVRVTEMATQRANDRLSILEEYERRAREVEAELESTKKLLTAGGGRGRRRRRRHELEVEHLKEARADGRGESADEVCGGGGGGGWRRSVLMRTGRKRS
ncbi:unnamed protein product [Closterium sp. Naga37s-1]|nr:unnamed protein product [Closterium sp. Naga37s-1]